MTGSEMKKILETADIRMSETAELFRVAPSTAYRWLEEGSTAKQPIVFEMASKLCELIAKATEAGMLPVKDVKGKQRLPAIRTAIRTAAAQSIEA